MIIGVTAPDTLDRSFMTQSCVVLGAYGGVGGALALDATSTGEVEACLRRAVEIFGRLDGVANCVGSLLLKPAHATTDQEWSRVLTTNLFIAWYALAMS